jgi:putative endopeptidase
MFTEAPFLSDDAQQALFDGFAALSGQKEQEARWKRAEHSTDSVLGESLGKLYVAKAFSPAAMVRTRKLIETILAALHDRIAAEPWMSAETKQKAQEKLRLVTIKVGYPKRWRDYARFEVKDDSWAANVLRGSEFEWDRQIKKLGKPIDRSEWSMTPPTVNAYYDSGANEIVFPAGILQAGFYDPLADNAANYGAIGMIIGHEITHGFDDRGRQFNGYGRRQDWWTPEDSKRYADLSAEILDQYSGLKNAFGQAINSKLTLSENIADVGGIALAYDAYHRSVNGKEPPVIDGFTGDQRFFLAAAQMYHGKAQKEWASFSLRLDVHSPTEIRAFAAASDQPAFYRAFNLVPPAHLPRLW